jgi:hypothetical protein
MKRRGSYERKKLSSGTGAVIGRDRFAKISAVEGVKLSMRAKERAARFDREGLSGSERIRAIVAAHRKG